MGPASAARRQRKSADRALKPARRNGRLPSPSSCWPRVITAGAGEGRPGARAKQGEVQRRNRSARAPVSARRRIRELAWIAPMLIGPECSPFHQGGITPFDESTTKA